MFSTASIPAQGFQSATQSVVGQNLGADQPARAARTATVGVALVGGVLTLLAGLQWTMAGAITALLAPRLDPAAFGHAVDFLRLLAVSYPAFGAMYVLQGGFNGAGRGTVSFRSSVLQYWCLQVPLAAVAGIVLGTGVVTVFGAIAASNVLTALVLGGYYRLERDTLFRTAQG